MWQLTCNEHFGVVGLGEGHRVEACVGRDLAGGEADVSDSDCDWLAAAGRGLQDLVRHSAQGSQDWHFHLSGTKHGSYGAELKTLKGTSLNP